MKVNEIETEFLIDYCNAYEEDSRVLEVFKDASISYIKSYTGLTEEEMMVMDDITVALLVLVNGMFDSRSIEADKSNVNVILDSILSMHSKNLI
nr:MAG TPA: tail connector protein [Caudoviricetes sp.]